MLYTDVRWRDAVFLLSRGRDQSAVSRDLPPDRRVYGFRVNLRARRDRVRQGILCNPPPSPQKDHESDIFIRNLSGVVFGSLCCGNSSAKQFHQPRSVEERFQLCHAPLYIYFIDSNLPRLRLDLAQG